jgi:hypothetical protein
MTARYVLVFHPADKKAGTSYRVHREGCSAATTQTARTLRYAIPQRFTSIAAAHRYADEDESEKAGEAVRASFKICPCARDKNPGPARHSRQWDDCVQRVRKSGSAVSPYAVCTQVLGPSATVKGRASNPLPRAGKYELTVLYRTRDGRERTVFQRFPTRSAAATAAGRLHAALHRNGIDSMRHNIRARVPFNP